MASRVIERIRAAPWSLTSGVAFISTVGIMLVPKDMTPGSSSRFVLTCSTFGAVGALTLTLVVGFRRTRESRLKRRHAGTSRSIQDTLSFLTHERRLSGRGRGGLTAGAYVAAAGAVLTLWPQCAPISSLHSPLKWLAGSCAALLFVQPFLMRKHLANAIYLGRCLRQQVAHIERDAADSHKGRKLHRSASDATFVAGGFRWSLDDLSKNLVVFGQPGSGKTVCVLNAILGPLIAARHQDLPTSGLILDPKGAYLDAIVALCARAGRSDDLYILSADGWLTDPGSQSAIAWNPLDTDEAALEVAARVIVVAKVAGGIEARDTFFLDAARLFIRHAFALCRAAKAPEPTNLIDLHRLCAERTEEAFQYRQILDILADRYPDTYPPGIDDALHYMETEWSSLPDKQRAGVRSTVNQLIDDFTTQPFAEMISGPSTIRIADLIDEGKILYVHLPLASRERLSRILSSFIKLEFQREVLRRIKKDRPSFLFADEYQTLFTSGEEHSDSGFFERSRESRHANVVAVQNLSSFLKKVRNRSDVMNFLGLCAVKVFLRNGERETNEWASNLFGERGEIVVTMSEAAQIGGWLSKNHTNYSRSTRALRIMPPEAFAELPIPVAGDPNRQFAGSIVHFGSRGIVQALKLDWPIHPLSP